MVLVLCVLYGCVAVLACVGNLLVVYIIIVSRRMQVNIWVGKSNCIHCIKKPKHNFKKLSFTLQRQRNLFHICIVYYFVATNSFTQFIKNGSHIMKNISLNVKLPYLKQWLFLQHTGKKLNNVQGVQLKGTDSRIGTPCFVPYTVLQTNQLSSSRKWNMKIKCRLFITFKQYNEDNYTHIFNTLQRKKTTFNPLFYFIWVWSWCDVM